MSDFLNRIEAQRIILREINSHAWKSEALLSMTNKSIDRWTEKNKSEVTDNITFLLKKAADKLFFLANKSQEQMTEDYKKLSLEVHEITAEIRKEMEKIQ